jgi:hypothetical protein
MYKKYLFFFCSLLFITQIFAQGATTDPVYFEFTTQQNRAKLYKQMVDTSIRLYLSSPIADSTEGEWNEAFWSIELLAYKNDFIKKKLTQAWKKVDSLSEYFQKNLLEVCYAVYPIEFKKQVNDLLDTTTSIPVFIRCAEYLLQADSSLHTINLIQALINTKFTGTDHVGLTILQNRLLSWNKAEPIPPLQDIFSKQFLKDQTVIYSIQRKDRNYPGVVVIRKPDGTFVKNKDSSFFHVSQLARAVTNYPFYITNGNTPQGIFRWTGFEISKLSFIGPTPNLQLVLPYEATPFVFFADSSLLNASWQKEMYESLLPASWKNYNGIYESFFAGEIGRSAIIMHGTTVDPAYYKGKSYYPQTPSLGCLCSYEEWNTKGFRVKSNQQQIDDALDTFDASNGYVVVIELNNQRKAVNIDEVKKFMAKAEKNE